MIIDLARAVRERLARDPLARGLLRQIGGAVELAAAQRAVKTLPAVFVLPLSEDAGNPLLAGEFRQRKIHRIAVVIAATDGVDSVGESKRGLQLVRTYVEAALVGDCGWTPEHCTDVVAWAGGKLARLDDNGVVWWQDEYVTSQYVAVPT